MLRLIVIGLGGAIGAIARYIVSFWVQGYAGASIVWGTFAVNIAGSLCIGFFCGLAEELPLTENMKMFVLVGLLGSFTTFSTFSYENFYMIKGGDYGLMALNISASVIVGLAMVFVGIIAARTLITVLR